MKRTPLALALSLSLLAAAWAEEPVLFPDANLKAAVEDALNIPDPTPTDMLLLTVLRHTGESNQAAEAISDLHGLEYATNLQTLYLRWNRISDISPLSGLTNLESVDLSQNRRISNLGPLSGLSKLRYLNIHQNLITNLGPLAGLGQLETLVLHINQIQSVSPLAGLTRLQMLDLERNDISDISSLAGLTELRILYLQRNRVSNLSSLSGLTHLRELNLRTDNVQDIAPLAGLTSLQQLDLRENPLNEATYDTYLPLILQRNPGVVVWHPRNRLQLAISSSAGGAVVQPGEGNFTFDYGDLVYLEARVDPGFAFLGFSGSFYTQVNPTFLLLHNGGRLRADFRSLADLLYVDDDAPGDPGPGDSTGSDAAEDGTAAHPFDSVQEALEVAAPGSTVVVRPGTYRENLDLLGKSLHLVGVDPENPKGGPCAVLMGTGGGPVIRCVGKDVKGTLTGFVITAGKGQPAGAILCSNSAPTLTNCLIVGNRATGANAAAVHCTNSQAVFVNCTIADNHAGTTGAGVTLIDSNVTFANSILWGNSAQEILVSGTDHSSVRYCDVQGGWPGMGNRNSDPLFARRGNWVSASNPKVVLGPTDSQAVWQAGDYHLQAQTGRWDPEAQAWVQDPVSSPGIDAGDRASPVGDEPTPNGGTINLGVYGGTSEASKSHPPAS